MIQVQVTTNAHEIIRAISQLEWVLGNMLVPMRAIEKLIPRMLWKRFDTFQRHAGTYKTAAYGRKKGAGGGRVGVKSGDLIRAISDGSVLTRSYEPYSEAANAKLTFGLNVSGFEHEYPKYFAKWLNERGDDLMALEQEQAEDLVKQFGIQLSLLIDGAFK